MLGSSQSQCRSKESVGGDKAGKGVETRVSVGGGGDKGLIGRWGWDKGKEEGESGEVELGKKGRKR